MDQDNDGFIDLKMFSASWHYIDQKIVINQNYYIQSKQIYLISKFYVKSTINCTILFI